MVVETYLDTSSLSQNQVLAIADEAGKRWDVSDSLESSADSSPRNGDSRFCEVVLERWTVSLGDASGYPAAELEDPLANVYKKGVVMFRSLFTLLRFLPAWRLYRRLGRQAGSQQTLKLKFRIKEATSQTYGQRDSLVTPLCPSQRHSAEPIVEEHSFSPLVCSTGLLTIKVEYRTNTDFRVADAEALLSSRFLGHDEPVLPPVGRSLPGARTQPSPAAQDRITSTTAREPRGLIGAYGSLGTFHGTEKRQSPVSALRQRSITQESDDEMDRVVQLRDGSRRGSLDLRANPPFKAGSIASTSPLRTPLNRGSASPASTSAGTSLKDNNPYAKSFNSPKRLSTQRTSTPVSASRPASSSLNDRVGSANSGGAGSSPNPSGGSRYSSSFANRKSRPPAVKGDSSEGSVPKSIQSPAASSGASNTDDDAIADFIGQLERARLRNTHANVSESAKRGVRGDGFCIDLNQYRGIRDGSTALAEEMSSSTYLFPSSNVTPPSRRLSNVPGLSISSSPSRALTYAPHVRSRLSTHSIAEEVTVASGGSAEGAESPNIREEDEEDEPFIFPQEV